MVVDYCGKAKEEPFENHVLYRCRLTMKTLPVSSSTLLQYWLSFLSVCIHLCMYVCMYVRIYLCVCVCIYVIVNCCTEERTSLRRPVPLISRFALSESSSQFRSDRYNITLAHIYCTSYFLLFTTSHPLSLITIHNTLQNRQTNFFQSSTSFNRLLLLVFVAAKRLIHMQLRI